MEKKYEFVKLCMLCCAMFIMSCADTNTGREIVSINDTNNNNLMAQSSDLKNTKELFERQRSKNTERFGFINTKGFTYKGKGGTVLVFPPDVFNCDSQDSVKMEICEFSDLTSMAQSNLSTLSNGKMLESNGMVYCKAYSNNKELQLKKGKSFKCMFNKPKSTGFKLFEGEDVEGIINWKNPVNEISSTSHVVKTIRIAKIENSKKEALTICTYGTPNDISDVESSLQFSNDASTHIISYFIDKYNIAFDDLIPFAPDESMMLNFILRKSGELEFIDSESPLPPKIKARLIGYFLKMPSLNGYTNPETGEKEDLPLYFAVCPNKILKERLEGDNRNMSKVNELIAEREKQEKDRQLEIEKQEKIALEKTKREYDILEKNREFSEKIDESSKVVYNSFQMGWINCDRFVNDNRQKVALDFVDLDQFTSFNVQVIFPKINSIYSISSNAWSNKFPIDEPIKIIFVGMKNTDAFFYSKNITTASVNQIAFASAIKIKENELQSYIQKSLK
ncbi:MAG: hypothetical protein V4580_06755 [Bacteroidota bacterium]